MFWQNKFCPWGLKNYLNLSVESLSVVGSKFDHNWILFGFSRIYLKDHIRIIMGAKCNHISILKGSYQDLNRITEG